MSTTMTERQRIMLETNALRDKAEALLKGLVDAKSVTEREMARLNRSDPMRLVTGKTSIDDGISSIKRMIETLNRSLAQARRDLDDDDIALLDELDAEIVLTHAGAHDDSRPVA